jgi:hypothetical protein
MPANAVVLDANLLVLLVVGIASPSYILKHKRTRADSAHDQNHTLLTSDLDLYLQACRLRMKAVNFNHHIEANRP